MIDEPKAKHDDADRIAAFRAAGYPGVHIDVARADGLTDAQIAAQIAQLLHAAGYTEAGIEAIASGRVPAWVAKNSVLIAVYQRPVGTTVRLASVIIAIIVAYRVFVGGEYTDNKIMHVSECQLSIEKTRDVLTFNKIFEDLNKFSDDYWQAGLYSSGTREGHDASEKVMIENSDLIKRFDNKNFSGCLKGGSVSDDRQSISFLLGDYKHLKFFLSVPKASIIDKIYADDAIGVYGKIESLDCTSMAISVEASG